MPTRLSFPVVLLLLTSVFAEGRQQAKTPGAREPDLCVVPSSSRPTLPARLMEGMGRSSFPITTTSPEAQAFFNQGVAQLHSFWVRESERSFMQAAQLDPDAAMAYWGIAISAAGDYRPAFQLMRNRSRQGQAPAEPDSGRARALEAIKKAMELRSRVSERERLYIEALSARRDPESKDATGEYTRGLRKLVAAYPDDLEAKSILALAIQNGYEPVTREPREGTMESLALLREILSRDPDHIGAHHYMIHGCEGGKRPQDAWQSCKRYPELVPNIPHALHMPGHIYAQSDRLEDAAHSFASAALTELGYMAADATYGSGHYGHNHHFLIHTLGLQGRYREAMSRTSELLRIKENPRERASVDGQSTHRQGWFCLMKTLVRFEKWDEILDGQTLPLHDKPREAVWYHWARGLAHSFKGNSAEAEASLREMRKSLETLKDSSKSIPPQLDAARVELEGHIEARSGKREKGLELLSKAARMENELIYTEPPAYPRPVLEALARTALALGNFKEAESAYRKAFELEPGSGRALWGIAQALYGAGEKDEADKVFAQFARVWVTADSDLPEMKKAQESTRPSTARTQSR